MTNFIPGPAQQPYDLAVIGGGPAGTAAAWTAARAGRRVLIAERGSLPRDRVCGEYISAEGLSLLAAMLETTRPDLLDAAPRIEQLRLSAGRREREFQLPLTARGLSRYELDAALWQAALAAGAEGRLRTTALRLEDARQGFRLWLRDAEREFRIDAHAVIVAAGRWWRLEGLREPENEGAASGGRWIGVKAHLESIQADAVELYFFRGGYCGLAPVGQGRVNACCLMQRRRLERRGAGLSQSEDFLSWLAAASSDPRLKQRLHEARQAAATVVTAPVRLGWRPKTDMRRPQLRLAGDAAGFIDPFTGGGIARALLGGQAAAERMMRTAAAAGPGRERDGRRAFYAAAGLRAALALPATLVAGALRLPGAAEFVSRAFENTRSRP